MVILSSCKKSLCIILLSFLCLSFFTFCKSKPSNLIIAESFVKTAFTLPNDELIDATEKFNASLKKSSTEDELLLLTQNYNKYITQYFLTLFNNNVSENKLTSGGAFYDNIVMLHIIAANHGYSYKLEDFTVTKSKNESIFDYTVKLNTDIPLNVTDIFGNSSDVKSINLTGSIQFNSDNKIDFVSVNLS